jgi:cell division protein FtsI/penicillin-binding protein 2
VRGRATLATIVASPFAGLAVALALPSGSTAPSASAVVSSPPAASDGVSVAPEELLERLPIDRRVLALDAVETPGLVSGPVGDRASAGHVAEQVPWQGSGIHGPLRVEYTLDAALTREVYDVLERGRVDLGHVIVMEPATGRVLAYASTAPEVFPATRPYPAASLIKVITAAAALDASPETARLPCRYAGSPYRLTPARLDPPRRGETVSLRRALATSNNQCFAQLAVHAVGADELLKMIARFGWLQEPAPAHAAGSAEAGEDRFDVGRLGCGLAGCRITPLHAVQMAAVLADGELVPPRWIERIVDSDGRELPLPSLAAPRRVLPPQLARELREMLIDTTTGGTARGAFRARGGRPLLGEVRVAGKTGSLSGHDPTGRYEWFAGVAPADDPKLAVVTLVVHRDHWWRSASQVAAEVLRRAFCADGTCAPENLRRWTQPLGVTADAARRPPRS